MSMPLRIVHMLLLGTVVAGCSRETVPATQVIVSIDAEPNVRARTASLQIQARGLPALAADAWDSDQTLQADLDQLLLPYSLALVPKNGDATREYEVLVTARTAETATGGPARYVSVSRTLGGYRANRRLLIEVMLTDDCIGKIACDPDQTCKAAECASAIVDPAALPEFSASMVPEAGVSKPDDAGMQFPPIPDAGEDAAVDPACPNGQCLCAEAATIPCGADNGICKKGVQTCVNNLWGPCLGQITGVAETCNGVDDDCDGNKDDNVLCDPSDILHSAQAACMNGVCVSTACEPSFGDCDPQIEGCEQPLNTIDHCGGCGATCETPNASPTCETGTCEAERCFTDYADCDTNPLDCETDLYDPAHCGGCGVTCARDNASTECGGPEGERACELTSCDGAFADCDADLDNGCEIDLDSDALNCGACDNDCTTKAHLDAGVCIAGQCSFDCQDNFVDCDGVESNGCEHDIRVAGCLRCLQEASNVPLGPPNSYPTAVDFNCGGTHTFDSTARTWDTACCGSCPDVSGPVAMGGSGDLVYILRASSLNVAAGATVKLIGENPVIIAVRNSATIAGTIDASAVATIPGAGGADGDPATTTPNCDTLDNGEYATGLDGTYSSPNTRGGGGGGFGTNGGLGGGVSTSIRGKARGASDLVPLRGGCSGGKGGLASSCVSVPATVGAGGGAVQLSVAGKLTITGTGSLLAYGGTGTAGVACLDSGGATISTAGAGGGSGGAILLEASGFSMPALDTVARVNGAAGGLSGTGQAGGAGSTNSVTAGSKGSLSAPNVGGGGGGGYGRVFMRSCVGP